jgi:hypothetical protein
MTTANGPKESPNANNFGAALHVLVETSKAVVLHDDQDQTRLTRNVAPQAIHERA